MDLPSKSDSAEAAARRAQIVAAARALLEERGLSHTTVKDITEACGVTRDYEKAHARIADGEFSIPDSIDADNDAVAGLFGVTA